MKPSTPAPNPPLPADRGGYKGETISADREAENRVVMRMDSEGYAVSGTLVRDDGASFLKTMRSARDRYPLEREAIVLPEGWVIDEEGRAYKEVIHDGVTVARLTTEDVILSPE